MDTASTPAAVYVRVSTEDQKRNFSLAGQLDLLRKYAGNNRFDIYKEYSDAGFSGVNYERPAFRDLLREAEQRKFKTILVYRLDRLFRSTKDLLVVSEYFEKLGIGLRSITEPFDTSNYLGKFVLSLLGSIAQLERDIFIERSKLGRIRRAQEGYYCGAQPAKFGYKYNPETKKLEVDEKNSRAVEDAFRFYCEPCFSLKKVARKLNRLGCRTARGNLFRADSIYDILRDPIYIGKWYANRYTKKSKLKPEAEWIEVKVPSLIDNETFNRTQRLLEKRRGYSLPITKYQYLLQGLVRCGDCGEAVKGTADKQQPMKNGKKYGPYLTFYYRCTYFLKRVNGQKTSCRLRYIQAHILETTVWAKIEDLLLHPESAAAFSASSESVHNFIERLSSLRNSVKVFDYESKRKILLDLGARVIVNLNGTIDLFFPIHRRDEKPDFRCDFDRELIETKEDIGFGELHKSICWRSAGSISR